MNIVEHIAIILPVVNSSSIYPPIIQSSWLWIACIAVKVNLTELNMQI